MIQLLGPGEDSLKVITLEELQESKSRLLEALWIDMFQPTEEEERFVEKALAVPSTTRNITTVRKLAVLLATI